MSGPPAGVTRPAGARGTASSTRRAVRAASARATSSRTTPTTSTRSRSTSRSTARPLPPPRHGGSGRRREGSSSPSSCTRSSRTRCQSAGTPRVRSRAAAERPLPQPAPADVDEFRAGLEPMAASGKLGAVLVQFPAGFHADTASTDYLAGLLRTFRDYPLAVELRHRTWSDAQADTLRTARQLRRGVGADRRTEIPDVDSAGPGPEHGALLLPAPPRPQRGAVVVARRARGALQLSLLARGAAPVRLRRSNRRTRGAQGLPLPQQPLRREVGGERDGAQAPARPGHHRRVPPDHGRGLPRAPRDRPPPDSAISS